jgi:ABC-type transporter Mla maintaining outer membrane lipid asymmetry permease subunit MlaE
VRYYLVVGGVSIFLGMVMRYVIASLLRRFGGRDLVVTGVIVG